MNAGCEQFVSNDQARPATAANAGPSSGAFTLVTDTERRAWDSNPRSRFPLIAVFKSQRLESRQADSGRIRTFLQVDNGPLCRDGARFGMPNRGSREQFVSSPGT